MFKNKRLSLLITLLLVVVFAWGVSAQNKTPFFNKRAGGGMVIADQTQTTGNYWFVDSGSVTGADAVGYGQNPDSPCLTIDYAIGLATANNGDIIVVMPGHSEELSTPAQINADVAGIRIVGLGVGSDRPRINWATSGASWAISASDVEISNIQLDIAGNNAAVSGDSAPTTGISIFSTVTGFRFNNNFVKISTDSGNTIDYVMYFSGGSNFVIANNEFLGGESVLSGITSVFYVKANSDISDVKLLDNMVKAYTQDGSAIFEAATSRVSGFYARGGLYKQGNTGLTAGTGASVFSIDDASGIVADVDVAMGQGFTHGSAGITRYTLNNTASDL